jgi:homoserine O-succinyltransferase
MPLVAHGSLPTFEKLQQRGQEVLSLDEALRQDIRELHIGFLNMMPDGAFQVTELQFMRMVGSCNQIAQFFVYPFTIPGLPRSREIQDYIDQYYLPFEQLREEGLDALIITGANVANPTLDQEPFWEPLNEIIGWATENVTSILSSCLATHAIVKALHRIERRPLPAKRWGVYNHRITRAYHPLLVDVNTRFDVPHSRNNDVSQAQLEAAGFKILVYSEAGGVHLAVSPDLLRFVFLQGHPEYDRISLLKEYKREVSRFIDGERSDYPPHPENYFSREASAIADRYHGTVLSALQYGHPIPPFPEAEIEEHLDNTWRDTGKAIFNNWLGLVYQLTHVDRKKPFMSGIDPEDPLGLRDTETLAVTA